MFFRMIKRDLKRRKSMNLILLVFVFLVSAFISASVGNILSITGALDHFFEVAQVPDSVVLSLENDNVSDVGKALRQIDEVQSFERETMVMLTSGNFSPNANGGTVFMHTFEGAVLAYFDGNNQRIHRVEPGTFYLTSFDLFNIKVGDKLQIRTEQGTVELSCAGVFKDPVLNTRILVNQQDFDRLSSSDAIHASLYFITTEDAEAVQRALDQSNVEYISYVSNAELRMGFVLHMVLAGALLIVSVFLMLISFVVLRFTIGFSISKEFRQIGVMKAIGLSEGKIRRMFTAKYLAISCVGAVLGYFASLPLGKALLKTVSQAIVMPTEKLNVVGIGCAAAVLLLTVLFSFLSTKKVKKLTPLDAIRSGSVGESFRKKSPIRMHKNSLRPSAFMAMNDIFSSPKRFLTLLLVFALCLALVLVLVNTTNTLRSEKLLDSFNWSYSHLFVGEEKRLLRMMQEDGREYAQTMLTDLEQSLEEQGFPARCFTEVSLSATIQYGEASSKTPIFQGVGTRAEEYAYERGTAPRHAGEIALAAQTAEELGAEIGDTVTIPSLQRRFMVTAIYQSMWNMGKGARVHESLQFSFAMLSSTYSIQVLFLDEASKEAIENRKEIVAQTFEVETQWVTTANEYVDAMIGVADSVDSVKKIVLWLALIVTVLITLLMEQSFLTKERREIALLKAMGFRNSSLILWHTMRFGITSVLASLLSLVLLIPLTKAMVGPVFRMMGAEFGIQYEIVASEVYVFYPLLFLLITIGSAALTSLQIRNVSTNECTATE